MKPTLLCPALLLTLLCLPVLPANAAPDAKESKTESVFPAKLERIREQNARKAREKMAADSKGRSRKEWEELESLYQKGNANPRLPENHVFLEDVIEKFPKSNRAGCAALYLARYSKNREREKYLEMAIEKYSDCYYGDGTSVGAFARYLQGMQWQQAGKRREAEKIFAEIKEDYPTATDHGGRLLVEHLPEK